MGENESADRKMIAGAVQKIVGIAALRRMHRLIADEARAQSTAKRWAGAAGGLALGLFFAALLVSAFMSGVEKRHLPPYTFTAIWPLFLLYSAGSGVALGFAAWCFVRYRFPLPALLGAGALIATVVSAAAAWYQMAISTP